MESRFLEAISGCFRGRLAVVSGQLALVIIPSVILIIWSPLQGMLILVVSIIFITFFWLYENKYHAVNASKKSLKQICIFSW